MFIYIIVPEAYQEFGYKTHQEAFTKAVQQAIKALHAQGLPAYQIKGGYIIAIYPDGREVKLQKSVVPKGY